MGRTLLRVAAVSLLLITSAVASFAEPTLLLRQPTVSGDKVAFRYAGDIWIANLDGSHPRRLTVHQAVETDPWLSPDGNWVAFTGEYEGNHDVYIVSSEGGAPIRLTYHPEPDDVEGWTPDGSAVLFNSYRSQYTRRIGQLYTVSVSGGLPTPLVLPQAEHGSLSPDGQKVAYTFDSDSFGWWKRYAGGKSGPIYLFDLNTHEETALPHVESTNDTEPLWMGDVVYFLSDRNFTMNIFAYDTKSGELSQITHHDDYDVRSVKGYGTILAYEQAGRVHVYDTATGESKALDIELSADIPAARPRYEDVSDEISWFSISPTGKRAVFGARGDIITVPADKGDALILTQTSNVHERYPVWSPDGNQIAFFSDARGEYNLHIVDHLGKGEEKVISLGQPDYYDSPQWSPDGKYILYKDNGLNLYYVDVKSGKRTLVDSDPADVRQIDATWSPDSRYIAYARSLENDFRAIFAYDMKSGKAYQLTDGRSDADSPVFSRDGKYLYFAASTDYAFQVSGLDMSSYEKRVTRSLYLIVLDKDTPHPFPPESDIENPATSDDEDADEVTVNIDVDNIDQRILALDISAGDLNNLETAKDGYLFYVDYADGGTPTLMRYSMDDREAESYLSGVRSYEISANGEEMLYSSSGSYGIVKTSGSPSAGDGSLELSGMEVKINPREEWAHMLREAWRLDRDYFYDPDMHGADWNAIWDKYKVFIPYVGHRSELNYVIGEMIGELVIGHAYVYGGDEPDSEGAATGLLGADFVFDEGRYQISRVFDGENWNPDARAPLTEPGVEVAVGDYILAINGVPLSSSDNIFQRLENTVGKQITLTVSSTPDTKRAREVTVIPISSERTLRQMAWVESNRRRVDEATDGRVAYVYLPDTGSSGFEFFNRYYYSQLDKDAVIIDERFNGGGSVADYFIDMLDRPLINWWITRNNTYYSSPRASIYGPKVMLINSNAGSGGDWLPFAFKKLEMGTVVGQRTWGGLVGISGLPSLLDGGTVTVPSFGIFSVDGKWIVENQGISPDIPVRQTPSEVISGKDPQLEKAIEVILKDLEDYTPPKPIKAPFPKRAAPQGK